MDLGNLQSFFQWIVGAAALLLTAMAIALVLACVLLVLAYLRVRDLELPPDADFLTTMRAVPFYVPLALDLLDFALDFLAAPVSWIVLGHLHLNGLRNTAVVEALIPFTQPIPTLTLSWVAVRLFHRNAGVRPVKL